MILLIYYSLYAFFVSEMLKETHYLVFILYLRKAHMSIQKEHEMMNVNWSLLEQ